MALILVADDDEATRRLVATVLERNGHTVGQVTDGKDVLPFMAEHQTDLLVTDILMLEQEGLETIRLVRAVNQAIPIIAMSSGGDFGGVLYLELAVKFGADATLAKPFMPAELAELADRLLAGDRAGTAQQ